MDDSVVRALQNSNQHVHDIKIMRKDYWSRMSQEVTRLETLQRAEMQTAQALKIHYDQIVSVVPEIYPQFFASSSTSTLASSPTAPAPISLSTTTVATFDAPPRSFQDLKRTSSSSSSDYSVKMARVDHLTSKINPPLNRDNIGDHGPAWTYVTPGHVCTALKASFPCVEGTPVDEIVAVMYGIAETRLVNPMVSRTRRRSRTRSRTPLFNRCFVATR
jgi:hypothetical protein